MPSPSPYLEATLSRWKDRNALVRRDIEIMLEGLNIKGELLSDLRQRVHRHRLDDIEQLREARRQNWTSWDERLKRMEKWMASGARIQNGVANVVAWRQSALGFDRARDLSKHYAALLESKALRLEAKRAMLADRTQQWAERLRVMEVDLKEFAERHASKTTEVLVSKARKQPYLDFVYLEREIEGKITLEFKDIRASVNRVLERLGRADQWVADRAAANPDHFEARKSTLLETWQPFHQKFGDIRENILHQALEFEEGRRRLRWIYEQVQRMRVVHESAPARRPFLERLFRPEE